MPQYVDKKDKKGESVDMINKQNKKSDMRVRYTKQILRDALVSLLEKKPLEKITVLELCEVASINRATFYKHYTDLFDLMNQLKEELKIKIIEHVKDFYHDEENARESFIRYIHLMKENTQLYLILCKEIGPDCLRQQTWEVTKEIYLKVKPGNGKKTNFIEEAKLRYETYGCTVVIEDWLENGAPISEGELADLILELSTRYNNK